MNFTPNAINFQEIKENRPNQFDAGFNMPNYHFMNNNHQVSQMHSKINLMSESSPTDTNRTDRAARAL